MAISLAHLPIWLWGGKTKGGKGMDPAPNGGSSSEWGLGLRDLDNVRFPLVKGSKMASPSSRKVKRKWKSREERRRIGKEYDNDVVLVPSDGDVCLVLNPMIRTGQLGGLNLMHLISRMMMRQTTVLQCWFLVIGMMRSRNWRQGQIIIIIISSWMELIFSKLSILMGKNKWRNGFHPFKATELATIRGATRLLRTS